MLVNHFLEHSAQRLRDKIALIYGEERLTYGEIDEKANRVAWFLRHRGIERQDRVAIFLDNSVESVISLFGILKANAIFLMLSPTLKAQKLSYILNNCQAKALITHTNKLSIVSNIFGSVPTLKFIILIGDKDKIPASNYPNPISWDKIDGFSSPHASRLAPNEKDSPCAMRYAPCGLSSSLSASPLPPYKHIEIESGTQPPVPSPQHSVLSPHDLTLNTQHLKLSPPTSNFQPPTSNIDLDLATIIYTSGSTGDPKGVMLTHLNMVSAATSITTYLENQEDDIIIDMLPLSFDYGLYQVIMAFKFGGTVVLEKSFTYPYQVIKNMIQEKVTGFPGVPTIYAILLGLRDLEKFDFSNLRYITNTAAALPPAHIEKLRKIFPHVRIYSMYGLTECKRVSYLSPEELDRRPASIGRGMPNEEVWIVDENGNRVEPGVVGELVVRGSNVMRGYWGLPEETERVLKPGKYPGERVLYTGDLFRMDEEGFLYFVGRKDDMIKSKGERISPKEIEQCLCAIDGIAEAAVIGIPDQILGQAIKAFIRCHDGKNLTEKDVLKHCKVHLEDFMVPQSVIFLDSFPKTSSNKIDKLALKELKV